MSWPILAAAMYAWRIGAGDRWQVAVAAAVLLLALPGILGPVASIPVQVDLPATALTVTTVAFFEYGQPAAGVAVIVVAAAIRETAPVWAALWLWSLFPLMALAVPLVAWFVIKPGNGPLVERFQHITDHPILSSLEHHDGQWRDGWIMVAPWGICLAALVAPDWRLVVVLVVAYAQLLVATDTVRLYQHAAGPVMAVAAAQIVPVQWLLLAVVIHVVWFRAPERI